MNPVCIDFRGVCIIYFLKKKQKNNKYCISNFVTYAFILQYIPRSIKKRETIRRLLMNVHPQLITIWTEPSSTA